MATHGLFSLIHHAMYAYRTRPRMVVHAESLGSWAKTFPPIDAMARDVPARVFMAWANMGSSGKSDWVVACTGLLVYFRMLALDKGRSRGGLALPSVAAYNVWRAWEIEDPQGLRQFLEDHLALGAWHVGTCPSNGHTWTPRALANTWVLGNALECIDARSHPDCEVPAIFAVDKQVRMPNGFAFYRDVLEPLGGYYLPINAQAVVGDIPRGMDILSRAFLYDMPHLDTPQWVGYAQPSLLSRVVGGLFEGLKHHRNASRRGPINPTRARKNRARVQPVSSDSFPESTGSVAMLMAARIVSEGASSSDYRSSADSSCGSGGGGSTTNGGGD